MCSEIEKVIKLFSPFPLSIKKAWNKQFDKLLASRQAANASKNNFSSHFSTLIQVCCDLHEVENKNPQQDNEKIR